MPIMQKKKIDHPFLHPQNENPLPSSPQKGSWKISITLWGGERRRGKSCWWLDPIPGGKFPSCLFPSWRALQPWQNKRNTPWLFRGTPVSLPRPTPQPVATVSWGSRQSGRLVEQSLLPCKFIFTSNVGRTYPFKDKEQMGPRFSKHNIQVEIERPICLTWKRNNFLGMKQNLCKEDHNGHYLPKNAKELKKTQNGKKTKWFEDKNTNFRYIAAIFKPNRGKSD